MNFIKIGVLEILLGHGKGCFRGEMVVVGSR